MQGDLAIQSLRDPIPDVLNVVSNGEIEHLVEIAVVQRAIPTYAQGIPTHDACRCRRIECLDERFHVIFVVAARDKEIEVAADGQIRDGQEVVEQNVVLVEQFCPVALFEG